jgi:Mg-chelatase subunit ChlD
VQAGGGTVLEPAYRAALRSLRGSPATIKHIILLTDGRVSDGGGPFSTGNSFDFTALAALGRRDGITTSSIAVGDEADTVRLESIARSGGGRFYEAWTSRRCRASLRARRSPRPARSCGAARCP